MSKNQEQNGAENHSTPTLLRDGNILSRLTLVMLLTFALFGAIRWALDVTTVNAKRVSHNLTQMQQSLDTPAPARQEQPKPEKIKIRP